MKDFQKGIMRGEFRGDFTRDTFHPEKTYSRVLMQQGRVQLDADWNEQVSIHLHQLRSLACDIGGSHWGPTEGSGFDITKISGDFTDFMIGAGHYYVNGILCETDGDITFNNQPNYPELNTSKKNNLNQKPAVLVYLDVWERHISFVEDDAIREVALGGPDTASREKVIWQVKLIPVTMDGIPTARGDHPFKSNYSYFLAAIAGEIETGSGKLQARAKDRSKDDTEPCLTSPEARYRGTENQLYRVEIHKPGTNNEATFKWSRENGSVIFPILNRVDSNDTSTLSLKHLGRHDRFSLNPDDWVELSDDNYILQNRAENLLQILVVDRENQTVTLKGIPDPKIGQSIEHHPYLRRWDQKNGDQYGITVEQRGVDEQWTDLEDGIQIKYPKSTNERYHYQSGDYWLIPARQITGDVEWPIQGNTPKALLPHGFIHHYAPLAILSKNNTTPIGLRRILTQNWK